MSARQNPNETFYLARYAYNTMRPMVDELESLGLHPQLSIEVVPASARNGNTGRIGAFAHWDREGMLLYKPRLKTTEAIDKAAAELRTIIDKVKAETQEAGIAA